MKKLPVSSIIILDMFLFSCTVSVSPSLPYQSNLPVTTNSNNPILSSVSSSPFQSIATPTPSQTPQVLVTPQSEQVNSGEKIGGEEDENDAEKIPDFNYDSLKKALGGIDDSNNDPSSTTTKDTTNIATPSTSTTNTIDAGLPKPSTTTNTIATDLPTPTSSTNPTTPSTSTSGIIFTDLLSGVSSTIPTDIDSPTPTSSTNPTVPIATNPTIPSTSTAISPPANNKYLKFVSEIFYHNFRIKKLAGWTVWNDPGYDVNTENGLNIIRTQKGYSHFTYPMPDLAGKIIRLEGYMLIENVLRTPGTYEGANMQIEFDVPGKRVYEATQDLFGSFPIQWKAPIEDGSFNDDNIYVNNEIQQNVFKIPADATNIRLLIGLQGTTGKVFYDGIRIAEYEYK